MMAFVHRGIAHHCSFVTSAAVATGAGNTLGNKGGVAIYLKVGNTRILVVNAHLAAHQNAEKQRNADYWKICRGIPVLLDRNNNKTMPKSNKVVPLVEQGGKNDSQADGDTSTSVSKNSFDGVVPSAGEVKSADKNTTISSDEPKNTNNENKPNTPAEEQASPEAQVDSQDSDRGVQIQEDTKTQQELQEEMRTAAAEEEGSALGAGVDIEGAVGVEASAAGTETAEADDGEEDGDVVLGDTELAAASSNSLTTMVQQSSFSTQPTVARSAVVDVPVLGADEKGLEQCGEAVIFMGDLNYRIKGNRWATDDMCDC
jgi:hypothetical protein